MCVGLCGVNDYLSNHNIYLLLLNRSQTDGSGLSLNLEAQP